MRFTKTVLALTAAALTMTGCSSLVSLNQVANDEETITDAGLPGLWDTGGKDGGMFAIRQEGTTYSVVYTEKSSSPAKFEGRLFQVGAVKVLDLVTTEENSFQVPVHLLVRVWPEGTTLKWAFLESDWLKGQARQELASQESGGRTLVTAGSPAVRAFIVKHGADERAYSEQQTLTKVQ